MPQETAKLENLTAMKEYLSCKVQKSLLLIFQAVAALQETTLFTSTRTSFQNN